MKISVPSHDAEYNHQPYLGDDGYRAAAEWTADTNDPESVLRLVTHMNNIILQQLDLLYQIDNECSNLGSLANIRKLTARRNRYHIN